MEEKEEGMNIGAILLDLASALVALAFEYGGAGLLQALLDWLLGL